jgi:hypothetical protein
VFESFGFKHGGNCLYKDSPLPPDEQAKDGNPPPTSLKYRGTKSTIFKGEDLPEMMQSHIFAPKKQRDCSFEEGEKVP